MQTRHSRRKRRIGHPDISPRWGSQWCRPNVLASGTGQQEQNDCEYLDERCQFPFSCYFHHDHQAKSTSRQGKVARRGDHYRQVLLRGSRWFGKSQEDRRNWFSPQRRHQHQSEFTGTRQRHLCSFNYWKKQGTIHFIPEFQINTNSSRLPRRKFQYIHDRLRFSSRKQLWGKLKHAEVR